MSSRRVVITGIGVVSPLGSDLKSFWENLVNGKSGIRRITQFDASTIDCQIAGEVADFNPSLYFKNPKDVRRADRFSQFAMASAKLALEDSGLDLEKYPPNIPVGRVATVTQGIGAAEPDITLTPFVNPTQLSFVQVLIWSPQ